MGLTVSAYHIEVDKITYFTVKQASKHNNRIQNIELDINLDSPYLFTDIMNSSIDIRKLSRLFSDDSITDFDRNNLSWYDKSIRDYNEIINSLKKRREEIQKSKSSIKNKNNEKKLYDKYHKQFFISSEDLTN